MTKYTAFLFKILFILFTAQAGVAQIKGEPSGKETDTMASRLDKSQQELKRLETQRMADSLQKALLIAQLEGLREGTRENRQLKDSIKAIELKQQQDKTHRKHIIDSLRQHTAGFPVRGFFNDTLFSIFARQGSFSAADRAAAISDRIQKLGGKYDFSKDSLNLTDTGSSWEIVYGDLIIVSLSDEDALWAGKPLGELANTIRDKIALSLDR